MIPLPTSILLRRCRSLVADEDGQAPAPSHPLQPYFDSGTIAICLDSDGASLDGSGAVTAIANQGAGGAAFDATVSGAPIPLIGNVMQMSASTGNCVMATPASIDGVRVMWACSTESLASSMRFMGSSNDEVRLGSIQTGTNPQVFTSYWSNRSGSGVNTNITPRWIIPASGMHLMEVETDLTAGTGSFHLDGAQASTVSGLPYTVFQVDRLGQGTGGTLPFVGSMGGMLGVITGRPDTAAAIHAARTYWASRFGLTLAQIDGPPWLNDPAAVAAAMTVDSVSAASLDYTTTSGAAAYAIPIPPAGSVVDFDITCSNTTYFRIDNDTDMTTPGYTELVSGGIAAGTQHVSVTVPSYTDRNFIGFRSPITGTTVQITKWTVRSSL